MCFATGSSLYISLNRMTDAGLRQTKTDDFSLYWASKTLRCHPTNKWQRVNQFPRTREITRKDTLARNIIAMQQLHGRRHFDFMPQSFILPVCPGSFIYLFISLSIY